MKIGILTYHRSKNYGAQLQAKALQNYVSSLGYETRIVDYWPAYHDEMFKPFSLHLFRQFSFIDKVAYTRRALFTIIRSCKRHKKTEQYVKKFLSTTNEKNFDVVLYGSDQIWRKQHRPGCESFNPVYFGEGCVETRHRIAYAASMGKIELDNEEDKVFVREHLSKFDAISIRESELIERFEKEFGVKYQLVCDPVLLLTKEQWLKHVDESYIPKEKYIFYYRLQGLSTTDNIVCDLVKQTGYRVIELGVHIPFFHYGSRYYFTADAQEFLSLLSGAEYVVTSSFHGVALSIVLEKQFYTVSKIARAGRVISLLSKLGLTDRFVNEQTLDLKKEINYDTIGKRLDEFSTLSRNWLADNLSKVKDSTIHNA